MNRLELGNRSIEEALTSACGSERAVVWVPWRVMRVLVFELGRRGECNAMGVRTLDNGIVFCAVDDPEPRVSVVTPAGITHYEIEWY